jgi:predicted nucleotidyltransferase
VIETLLTVSPRHLSFVFTNYMRGESEADHAVFLEMVAVAEARESLFVPVILSCETPELVRRIVRDDRRARMRLVNPVVGAEWNDHVPQFTTDHPNALRLDVTRVPPAESAQAIIALARQDREPNANVIRALRAACSTLSDTLTNALLETTWSSGKQT